MTTPDDEITPLRDAVNELARDPERYRGLFWPPAGAPVEVRAMPRPTLAALEASGTVVIEGAQVVPRLRLALRGEHLYYLSLSPNAAGDDYLQDVWPETDAVLTRLRRERAPLSVLDVGTGSGCLAIEAALAGHRVTAVDLSASALRTAAWNARLHGVSIELLRGDLYAPVAGRRFDRVLSAPHYSGPADYVRIDTLREGPAHVAPGGALIVATPLEWESGQAPGVLESLLRPMAERGAAVHVTPVAGGDKARWFTQPDPPTRRHPARHRFLIEVAPEGPRELHFERPAVVEKERLVPLRRLIASGESRRAVRATASEAPLAAALLTPEDLGALDRLLASIAAGAFVLDEPVPFWLVDACRVGANPCQQAHRAIVDVTGGIRPCPQGGAIGSVGETAATYEQRMRALLLEVAERRGCASCAAQSVCSRCAFPAVIDEVGYCDLMRRHAAHLPLLHHILRAISWCWPDSARSDVLAVKLRPTGQLLFAQAADVEALPGLPDLALRRLWGRMSRSASMLLASNTRSSFIFNVRGSPREFPLERAEAALLELAIESRPRGVLMRYATRAGIPPVQVTTLLARLEQTLSSCGE